MLYELNISDFAIIDQLNLRLGRGFNVLTGETGAGKSIIIDALGMLRGEKAQPAMVRAGSARARIEGVFQLDRCPDVVPTLREYGLWEEEDEQVILTREISAESGRSVARINGRAVNAATLRDVGSRLIDIHGQHEGLSLFNTRTHLDMLDRFGALVALREEVGAHVARLRTIRTELDDLRQSEARRVERIEELRVLLEDVHQANLRPDEEQELLQERSVMQNAVRLGELASAAYALLAAGDESGSGVGARPIVEALGVVADNLDELARIDPTVEALASQATDLQYQLEDLASGLRDYRDRLDFDPRRLDEIEERLTLIRALQRKYGGNIATILERAANAEAEIDRLTHSADYLADLEAREAEQRVQIGLLASELSRRRRATGADLARQIEGAMGDLAMPRVRFAVQLARREEPQGVPVPAAPDEPVRSDQATRPDQAGPPDQTPPTGLGQQADTLNQASQRPQLDVAEQPPRQRAKGQKRAARQTSFVDMPPDKPTQTIRYAFDRTGIDQVEFLITPNPGEPLKPLAQIASGGESARLLLALKSILSRVDSIPTLVFDEIDVGVGGRAGQVVGQKLWAITDSHQVICITHLPQVAAFADAHVAISKEVVEAPTNGTLRTRTRLRTLDLEQQIDELAMMLDGTPSEHSRASAREIIERAIAFKHGEEQQRSRAAEEDRQGVPMSL